MKSFRDLEAWKVALELLTEVYALTKKMPSEEKFGLVSQSRRASVSILANIAEGFGRFTYADKANKFTIARGECNEVEAFMYATVALEFLNETEIKKALLLIEREQKLLSGLISSCKRRI